MLSPTTPKSDAYVNDDPPATDSSVRRDNNNALADSGPCQHVQEEEQTGDLVFQRYCHVYKEGELEEICSGIPGCRIVESGWDRGNWFVQLEKFADRRLDGVPDGPESAIPVLPTRKY